jgi:hypothetical protein
MFDFVWSLMIVIGIPFYLYLLVRILTVAICRSIFETKKQFNQGG